MNSALRGYSYKEHQYEMLTLLNFCASYFLEIYLRTSTATAETMIKPLMISCQ